MLRLYQRLLGLRATAGPLRAADRTSFDVRALDDETIVMIRRNGAEQLWIVVRLGGAGAAMICHAASARTLLTSEDAALAVDPQPLEIEARGEHLEVHFHRPGAVILQATISNNRA